jgi:hypothetical protein
MIKTMEIFSPKILKINTSFTNEQEHKLLIVLKKHTPSFAWNYRDMKGIHPNMCIDHIYIKENYKPIRQPQKRMNHVLKDIVKEELQKILDAGFIYPISNSEWVSPLVIIPKK